MTKKLPFGNKLEQWRKSVKKGRAEKSHRECAALSWNACDLYVATMGARNGQGQVEAQTCAGPGTASISSEEPVKNQRQVTI
jgi:hypothetical protein